ncbi:MAG: TonB-dependent receptor [Gammaproteobacteria bacterium]|nr:TonB-dependent receptor [Gammaproteobacteria bacterium]
MEFAKAKLPLLFVSLSLLSTTAGARDRDLLAMSVEDLLMVTITSTSYFDETVLSSANSVTQVSAPQWDERGNRNLGELLNTLPSTLAVPTNGGTRTLAIRGYFHTNTGVSVRLDDVPMNKLNPGNSLEDLDGYDLDTLQTVELIRGPGSAMHGADAFHGVLSLQTLEPDRNGATLRTSLGSEEYGAASTSGHWGDDRQQVTAAVAYRGIGDQDLTYPYTDPDTGQQGEGTRSNRLENANLLFKYSAQPTAATRLYANTYLLKLDADELPALGRAVANQSYLKDQDHSQMNSETGLLKLGVEHQISASNVLTVSGFGWQNSSQFFGDFRTTPIQIISDEVRDESRYGLQILDRYRFSDRAHLALGYEYNESTMDKHKTTLVHASGAVLKNNFRNPDTGYTRKLDSLIIDGRAPLPWDTLELVYGGRLDDYSDFDRQFSPRLGLLHTTDDQAVLKILYGHAYRAPNLSEMFGSEQLQPNFDLQAEEMDSLELVYQKQTRHWVSTLTLFQNLWSEWIRGAPLEVPSDDFLFQFRNTGRNEAYGVEAETQARWDQARLSLAASYVRSENVDSGEVFSAFPEWMLDLGWGYRFSAQWDVHINNRLLLRDAASAPVIPGDPFETAEDYFRTDLELAWSPADALITRAIVRNLFDRTNYLPSFLYHESGIPDNGIGLTLALELHL